MAPASAGWERGGLSKGTMASACTSVWEQTIPLALALKPDSSAPPHTSLAHLKQLLQRWSSERVSPSASKSGCGPFKRKVSTSHSPLSHSNRYLCWLSQPVVVGISLLGTGTLSWGSPCVAGTLCSSGGGVGCASKIALPILHCHLRLWDCAILRLHPAYYFEVTFDLR
uniref:Uncharacterized protein n=1 Tax=Rousettus aegyptiacus TaxID=9407 RepID=A0A7J8HQZ8_ROUAE|nr:hypothetical protein HJG63_010939 [Rousettus aegyptiacus]